MGVKFIIDSASDVLPHEAQAMGVSHLPLKVIFGEEEFADAVTITHEDFFEKLTSSKELPTTSQVSPADFADCYERITANGDQAVVITVSSKLSGTYQSAMIASEGFEGKVFLVDSLSACIGERVLLMRGLELAKEGLSAEEIANALNEEKNHLRVFAMIDTLEYLKKGGRISAATALAGNLLSIKPAIAIADGAVSMAGKARGARQGNALLRQLVEDAGGINPSKPIALVYAGASDELLTKFMTDNADLWDDCQRPVVSTLGCAIGTHVGPGAYGIAFFEK